MDETPLSVRPRPPLERARGAAGWLLKLAADNAGGAVYGTVLVGVLLAAEDSRHEGYPETIAAAAIMLALYWAMSFYTHTLGERLLTNEPLNATLVWRTCAHELPIIEGALIPVLALLVAWAWGAPVTTAVTVALWVAAATIVALELVAARRARLRVQGLWLQAGAGAVIGLAIIALKLVLH